MQPKTGVVTKWFSVHSKFILIASFNMCFMFHILQHMGTHIGVGVTLTLIVHVCSYTANGYRIETKTFIVTCVHLSPFIYSQRTDLILPGAKPLFLRDLTIKEILESFLTKTFIF